MFSGVLTRQKRPVLYPSPRIGPSHTGPPGSPGLVAVGNVSGTGRSASKTAPSVRTTAATSAGTPSG